MDTESRVDPQLAEAISRLRDTQPGADLWPAIAGKLTPRHPRGVLLIRWPVAIAAGLVIAAATAAGTALVLRQDAESRAPTNTADVSAPASIVTASFAPDDAALARAIGDLERAVRSSIGRLNPDARRSVNESLTALDAAIAQAAARESAAPSDPTAARYLTSTLRKKLQLLRTVSQLAQQS
ncbi:MAG: hypothetical protein ACREK8_06515 [Gemmatimonadales bacterium]